MDRLTVIDGYGYIFRAHFGIMNAGRGERRDMRLATSEGFPTGALFVFARMMMRLYNDVRPERVAVVFDSGKKGFRSELYPDYKAHRPPAPEDLVLQMPHFEELILALGWPVLRIDGVEADDVIATLVTQSKARGWQTVIYSADKDLMQLVGDGVTMVDSLGQRTFDHDEVVKKLGVPPARVADFLTLTGDSSDNIPGLAGVGPKTAVALIDQYPSIAAMIAANPPVPRLKVKQPFADPEQLARLQVSAQLVALKTDVPLPVSLDALTVAPRNTAALRDYFAKFEFFALAETMKDAEEPSPARPVDLPQHASTDASEPRSPAFGTMANQAIRTDYVVAINPDVLAGLATMMRAAPMSGVWIESLEGGTTSGLVSLAIAVPEHPVHYVPLGHRAIGSAPPPLRGDLAPLWAALADATVRKWVFDVKAVTRQLLSIDVALAGADDSMIASFLLDATSEPSITGLASRHLGHELRPRDKVRGKGQGFDMMPLETVAPWMAEAASVTLALGMVANAALPRQGLSGLYRDIELPATRVLGLMETRGIRVDLARVAELAESTAAQLAALERDIAAKTGQQFNVASPKQLSEVLFGALGLPPPTKKQTKLGYSTDHETLEQLVELHPAVALILQHRELSKLKGTYLDALPPLVRASTGRLHTTFHPCGAATGRISSTNPNLQNIPIRSDVGKLIRGCFVAAPGQVLIALDYSQIELRILAHLSGDPLLSRAFRDGADVHTQTAAEVFDVAPEVITSEQRRIAKAVNYGLAYGQTEFGLARTLGVTRREADSIMQRYFARLPTLRKFMEDLVAQATRDHGVRTMFGRWRPIPELGGKNHVARKAAERIAQNTPMQGAGADIMKLAIARAEACIESEKLPAQLLLTVHDELVLEAPPQEAPRVAERLRREMESVATLDVPLVVEVGIAETWADA